MTRKEKTGERLLAASLRSVRWFPQVAGRPPVGVRMDKTITNPCSFQAAGCPVGLSVVGRRLRAAPGGCRSPRLVTRGVQFPNYKFVHKSMPAWGWLCAS